MITRHHLRRGANLKLRDQPAPAVSVDLERDGFAIAHGLVSPADVDELRRELMELFESTPPQARMPGSSPEEYADFRYEALNSSPAAQRAVAHPGILEIIEPLLGEDCHVVSNTAWFNQPEREKAPFDVGNPWHVDAGPHVPRAEGIPWDDRIPYPVFMIGLRSGRACVRRSGSLRLGRVLVLGCRSGSGCAVSVGPAVCSCSRTSELRWRLDGSRPSRPTC